MVNNESLMSLDTVNQQGSRTSNLERPKCRGACPRNGGCFIHFTGKPWLGFNGLGLGRGRARSQVRRAAGRGRVGHQDQSGEAHERRGRRL